VDSSTRWVRTSQTSRQRSTSRRRARSSRRSPSCTRACTAPKTSSRKSRSRRHGTPQCIKVAPRHILIPRVVQGRLAHELFAVALRAAQYRQQEDPQAPVSVYDGEAGRAVAKGSTGVLGRRRRPREHSLDPRPGPGRVSPLPSARGVGTDTKRPRQVVMGSARAVLTPREIEQSTTDIFVCVRRLDIIRKTIQRLPTRISGVRN
jgi:hypothetical protein